MAWLPLWYTTPCHAQDSANHVEKKRLYRGYTAGDGAQALLKLSTTPCSLILTDDEMRFINGWPFKNFSLAEVITMLERVVLPAIGLIPNTASSEDAEGAF
jgi:hypothetical protein